MIRIDDMSFFEPDVLDDSKPPVHVRSASSVSSCVPYVSCVPPVQAVLTLNVSGKSTLRTKGIGYTDGTEGVSGIDCISQSILSHAARSVVSDTESYVLFKRDLERDILYYKKFQQCKGFGMRCLKYNINYMSKYDELVYNDQHHIHKLVGAFVGKREYTISIESQSGTGKIFVNMKLNTEDLLRLKKLVRFELRQEFDTSKDYYVSLNEKKDIKPRSASKFGRHVGGAPLFPIKMLPYSCDGSMFDITSIIVVYDEPAVSYVERLGATTHAELITIHNTTGYSYFDDKIALLTPANFANWHSVLLLDHLNKNKYAHNGINEAEITEILSHSTRADYPMLQLLHSILHIYDVLYTHMNSSMKFDDHMDLLHDYSRIISDERIKHCFFRMLNDNAGDFLRKAPDGNFAFPYAFSDEAMPDKDRQYSGLCGKSVLIPSLETQLRTGTPVPRTSSVSILPNT